MNIQIRTLVCFVSLAVAAPGAVHASPASEWTGAAPAAEAPPVARPPDAGKQVKKGKKGCSKGAKRCVRRRPRPDPELVRAEAIRGRILESAAPMIAGGRHEEAATLLANAAQTHVDPVLYLAAAEVRLAAPRTGERGLSEASTLSAAAKELVLRPVAPRIAPDAASGLLEHSEVLTTFVETRREQLRQVRRGRAQLVTGGVFLAIGVGAVGLLSSGAVVNGRVDAAREAYTGSDAAYTAALDRTDRRADTMVAAGVIAGLAGMAIGVPLTATGARELKRARGSGYERPRLHIAPGLASVSLTGRF